jgi:hypothetical protein
MTNRFSFKTGTTTRSSNTSDKTHRTTEADDKNRSSLKTGTTTRSSYTSDKPQRTTETDDKIGPHLRQEQQYDPLTPLPNFKEQQKPMT